MDPNGALDLRLVAYGGNPSVCGVQDAGFAI